MVVAVYAHIGEKDCNLSAKAEVNNIFGSTSETITYIKDMNNKTLNSAQKLFGAIKELLQVYTLPGEMVLDLFAETDQVAKAAVELGISSLSVEKDPLQVGVLREFLQKAASSGVPRSAIYQACNRCSKWIGEGQQSMTCKSCGKPMHGECAVQGSSESEHFCSIICKSSVL